MCMYMYAKFELHLEYFVFLTGSSIIGFLTSETSFSL